MTNLPILTTADAAFVTDRLLVGGDLDGIDPALARAQLADLVERGVTHILDTRLEWTDQEYVARHAPQVDYLHLGVDDDGGTLPDAWFDKAVGWLDAALGQPDTRVLVHCHMGVNRSPSLAFGYLLHAGHGVREALTAIRAAREIAVIDYADDALAWHHRRTGAATPRQKADQAQLAKWRQANLLDAEHVIRGIRQDQSVRRAALDLGAGAGLLCRRGSDEAVRRCWLFQMSAEQAANCLADFEDDQEAWILPLSRYIDDVNPDDLVLLWRMGPGDTAGIFGYGIVTESGVKAQRPKDWADPDGPERLSPAVEADLVFVAPQLLLTRPELKRWPEFTRDRFDLFKMAQRPNAFPVEAEHLDRVAALLRTKATR